MGVSIHYYTCTKMEIERETAFISPIRSKIDDLISKDEIPFAAQELVLKKKCDGVITLGAVIRGETPHFDYVCDGLVQGIMRLQMKSRKPVAFGVLTTNTDKQAMERSGGKHGNKGRECAQVVLQILNLKEQPQRGKRFCEMLCLLQRLSRNKRRTQNRHLKKGAGFKKRHGLIRFPGKFFLMTQGNLQSLAAYDLSGTGG